MNWTVEDLKSYALRRLRNEEAARKEMRELLNHENNSSVGAVGAASSERNKVPTDEHKLNKTERAYLNYLRASGVKWIGVQNITLKLAHDCRLTVDFVYFDEEQLVFVDVKGFQREDALIKMKVAARLFPFWKFQIVSRIDRGWRVKDVRT